MKRVLYVTAALVGMGLLYQGFIVDDAFIFLTYAKHLANNGQIAFNLGEPVNAISSPLWFLMTFAVFLVSDFLGSTELPALGIRILSGAFTWWAAYMFVVLVKRIVRNGVLRILATVLFFANPWLWRWAFSGMETGLALAVVVTSLVMYESEKPLLKMWSPLILLTFGTLTRPELTLLSLLFFGHYLYTNLVDKKPLRLKVLAASLGISLLPVIVWLAYIESKMTSILPQTAAAKKGAISSLEAASYLSMVLFSSQSVAIVIITASTVVLLGQYARRASNESSFNAIYLRRIVFYTLPVIVLSSAYISLGYIPLSRYLLPFTPFLVVLSIIVLDWASRELSIQNLSLKRFAYTLATVSAVLWAIVTFGRVLPASSGKRELAYKEIGTWLNQNSSKEAKIASTEIGVLGYYSNRYIVDLSGLVLPEQLTPLRDDRSTLLRMVKPDYTLGQFEDDGVEYLPLMTLESVPHTASLDPSTEMITLYKAKWR